VSASIAPVGVVRIAPLSLGIQSLYHAFLGTSRLTDGQPNYRCKGDGHSNSRDVEPVDHLGTQAPCRTISPLTGPHRNRWKEEFNFRTVNGLQAPSHLQV
jgi:hypothetical protein